MSLHSLPFCLGVEPLLTDPTHESDPARARVLHAVVDRDCSLTPHHFVAQRALSPNGSTLSALK